MTPTVNVIYVGGTVHRLAPFLDSLLCRTAFRLRLVANGCRAEEEVLLAAAVDARPDRLEMTVLSRDRVMSHGEALDVLLAAERGPYFCVIDSDVYASGSAVIEDLLPRGDQIATCGLLPLWHRASDLVLPPGFQVVAGRFVRTADGQFLGCSYGAAYRTEALRSTLAEWGISMRRSSWTELSPAVRAELGRRGLRCRLFDTAKVANLLLHTEARPMVVVDVPGLVHVGALSGPAIAPPGRAARARHAAAQRAPWLTVARLLAQGTGAVEARSMVDLARRRREAVALVDALQEPGRAPAPLPDWIDPGVAAELERLLRGPVPAARGS